MTLLFKHPDNLIHQLNPLNDHIIDHLIAATHNLKHFSFLLLNYISPTIVDLFYLCLQYFHNILIICWFLLSHSLLDLSVLCCYFCQYMFQVNLNLLLVNLYALSYPSTLLHLEASCKVYDAYVSLFPKKVF